MKGDKENNEPEQDLLQSMGLWDTASVQLFPRSANEVDSQHCNNPLKSLYSKEWQFSPHLNNTAHNALHSLETEPN